MEEMMIDECRRRNSEKQESNVVTRKPLLCLQLRTEFAETGRYDKILNLGNMKNS